MGKWTIKVLDTIVCENLELNGNNFISNAPIALDALEGKITAYSDEGEAMFFYNAVAEKTFSDETSFWFYIREKSREELLREQLSNTDVAMCDLYEKSLMLENASLSQDEALIELYNTVFNVGGKA